MQHSPCQSIRINQNPSESINIIRNSFEFENNRSVLQETELNDVSLRCVLTNQISADFIVSVRISMANEKMTAVVFLEAEASLNRHGNGACKLAGVRAMFGQAWRRRRRARARAIYPPGKQPLIPPPLRPKLNSPNLRQRFLQIHWAIK